MIAAYLLVSTLIWAVTVIGATSNSNAQVAAFYACLATWGVFCFAQQWGWV